MNLPHRARFALLAAFFAASATAAETGIASRELTLYAGPRGDTAVVARLPAKQRYEVLATQRAWAQIAAGGQQGWVLYFHLIPEPEAKPDATGEIKSWFGVASARKGGPQVTATIGVRGITEEQLKAGTFNEQALKQLETLGVSKQVAAKFAGDAKLAPRNVEFLPAPVAATPASASEGRRP